jgi:hypothetical protein
MSNGGLVTARVVLFGTEEPDAALAKSGGWGGVTGRLAGVLGRLSPGGRAVVERELSAAVTGLLNLSLGKLLIAGLRRHPALAAAARATATNPAATEVVQLATHRITSAHQPHVDVVVNGVRMATLNFELDVTFDVDSVVATVREARLVALHSGRCTVRVSLACEGYQIASRDALLDPALTANLGEGIALLGDGPPTHVQGRAAIPAQGEPF